MENYLYFANNTVETVSGTRLAADAIMVPASNYLGCDPRSGSTMFKFKATDGSTTTDEVELTHTAGKNKEVIEALMRIMNSDPMNNSGVIIVADAEAIASKKYVEFHKEFNGFVTDCDIS